MMAWIRRSVAVAFLAGSFTGAAYAAEPATLVVPAAVERTGMLPVTMRFSHAHTGPAQLTLRWTDTLGRTVLQKTSTITLMDEVEFSFLLDLSKVVAMKNTIDAALTMEDQTAKGVVHTEEHASATFIAKPRTDGWRDFEIIMYQRYPSAIQPKLNELGINAGQVEGHEAASPDYLIDNNMRWYSEQIATDFYAEYHRFRTDRGVDWSYQEAKRLYEKDPTSKEALKRHPSFWDPEWRARIHDRLVEVAKRNDPYKPYFYSLSDESGIADLGAQWDFDFSDQSLVPMREWLRNRYGTLAALNAEWGNDFHDWNLVMPMTTNEAMQRKDDNFAAWGDFKEWMDISYANALQMGVDAVHEVVPDAYVGIVGAQKPGWGGYDYSRLTRTVGVMEPYDIGNSVKLAHSLNPQIPLLTTTFASGDWEKHRVWYETIQGNRGLILWDEDQRYIRPDGSKGAGGLAAEGYYNELRDGMGALLINSTPSDDGIAVHYSQPSLRTEWLLERRPDGDAWMKRGASYERGHNDFLRLRESWSHAIEDQGMQFNFVSYLQVEDGELAKHGYRVLILPHSSSMSAAEAERVREFVAAGGTVIADAMPAIFNEHSRRLAASPLADLFDTAGVGPFTVKPYFAGRAIYLKTQLMGYLQDRLMGREQATSDVVTSLFAACGLHPAIRVTGTAGKPLAGVIAHTFRNGEGQLLALQTNPQQQVDELGPANFVSNRQFEKTHVVKIALPTPMYVYNTRTKQKLGRLQTFTQTIDIYEPTVLALSPTELPDLQVSVPSSAERGGTLPISMKVQGTATATQVYHVDVLDPQGKRQLQYSGNVYGSSGVAEEILPVAVNDMPGKWTIRVREMMSGSTQTKSVEIR